MGLVIGLIMLLRPPTVLLHPCRHDGVTKVAAWLPAKRQCLCDGTTAWRSCGGVAYAWSGARQGSSGLQEHPWCSGKADVVDAMAHGSAALAGMAVVMEAMMAPVKQACGLKVALFPMIRIASDLTRAVPVTFLHGGVRSTELQWGSSDSDVWSRGSHPSKFQGD